MNFRLTTLLFFMLLLAFNLMRFLGDQCLFIPLAFLLQHPAYFYLPLVGLYLTIPVILSFFPCSLFHYKPVICKAKTTEKVVAITFDDGPDPEFSPLILDILRKHQIKATFFLIGKNIPGNEEIVKTMEKEGHIIGNHSYTHCNFWDFWPPARIYMDLLKNQSLIQSLTGKKVMYFRPPFGVINPMVSKAIRMTSSHVICWNIRSLDTLTQNRDALLKRITRNLKGGDIILLHDNREMTAGILDELIHEISIQGFRISPLDQMINQPWYE